MFDPALPRTVLLTFDGEWFRFGVASASCRHPESCGGGFATNTSSAASTTSPIPDTNTS